MYLSLDLSNGNPSHGSNSCERNSDITMVTSILFEEPPQPWKENFHSQRPSSHHERDSR